MALAVFTPPFVLSLGLWQAGKHGFWQPKVQDFQQAVFAQARDGDLAHLQQQGRGQHVLLCAQTGLRQQAARREAVARHVHGQV